MIELIAGSSDTEAMAQIRNAVMRWILVEPQTIEHFRGTMPGYRDWLAVLDGDPIGVADCARIAGMEESAAAFAVNCVLPEARTRRRNGHLPAGISACSLARQVRVGAVRLRG
jgi:hypothetical protein